jgi:hypothetical protein
VTLTPEGCPATEPGGPRLRSPCPAPAQQGTPEATSAAYYLEGLAAVAGQQDNPQRAVRLLAAARSLPEAKGSGWLHAFVPRVPHDDAVLEALRSRMGEAAFEEARAWGASTGSRRAREYALE